MKLWLAFPLFALAQASCYDYEYYDPDTGASLGDACGSSGSKSAGVSSSGSPLTPPSATQASVASGLPSAPVAGAASVAPATLGLGAPTATLGASFGATATLGAAPSLYSSPVGVSGPVAYTSAPAGTPYSATTSIASAPISAPISAPYVAVGAPAAATVAYSAPASLTAYAPATVTAVPASVTTISSSAPAAVTVGRAVPASGNQPYSLQQLQAIGQDNARLHRINSRTVRQASSDLSRDALVNTVLAGSGKAEAWYPWMRLGEQQKEASAYKSEARIADRNAHIAYQQYQANPTQLNALVSRYQSLDAQLADSAHHYNVINSGTFGQALSTGILGGLGSSALVSEVLTSRSENDDLQSIQRQMKRVARQITTVARSQQGSKTGQAQVVAPQGSVQQRMMALSVYGPQSGRR